MEVVALSRQEGGFDFIKRHVLGDVCVSSFLPQPGWLYIDPAESFFE